MTRKTQLQQHLNAQLADVEQRMAGYLRELGLDE
jgi:hypothetical protein